MFDPEHCICLFCGSDGTAKVAITKKGAPYFSCAWCKARLFIQSPASLAIFREILPDVALFIEQIWIGANVDVTSYQIKAAAVPHASNKKTAMGE